VKAAPLTAPDGCVVINALVAGPTAVAGNAAVITPEFIGFVADADVPATVKKLALTPVNVYPAAAVKVIVAVYAVTPAKVVGEPDHVTVPVYPFAEVTVVTGVAPTTGAVTPPIAATEITSAGADPKARIGRT
jgi:hypothetical protein